MKDKKKAIISIFSIMVCIGLLVGATLAWFTDTASNTGNRIVAGNLDIKLEKKTDNGYVELADGSTEPIFDDSVLWEPGFSKMELLRVSNGGSLALKYKMTMSSSEDIKLAEVIDVYAKISEEEITTLPEKYADVTTIGSGFTKIGKLKDLLCSTDNDGIAYGVLLPASSSNSGNDVAPSAVYVAIVLHMDENAGNEYQETSVGGANGFNIKLEATQYAYEYDSFDNQYDAVITQPRQAKVLESSSATNNITVKLNNNEVNVISFQDNAQAMHYYYIVDIKEGDKISISWNNGDRKTQVFSSNNEFFWDPNDNSPTYTQPIVESQNNPYEFTVPAGDDYFVINITPPMS